MHKRRRDFIFKHRLFEKRKGDYLEMSRVYNFSAGPAVLPEEVLKEAAADMLDYKGCGMSVMEMSHRSKMFDNIIKEAEADLRKLMNIPDLTRWCFSAIRNGSNEPNEE